LATAFVDLHKIVQNPGDALIFESNCKTFQNVSTLVIESEADILMKPYTHDLLLALVRAPFAKLTTLSINVRIEEATSAFVKKFSASILSSKVLKNLNLSRAFMQSFDLVDTALPFFLRILGLETLRSVCIESLPCFDYEPSEIKVKGISSRLQKLLVKVKSSRKEQYARWVNWLLFQIKAHVCLRIVVVEPLNDILSNQRVLKDFFSGTTQDDQTDKEVISMTMHLLKENLASL
jgi:hypothetical protein